MSSLLLIASIADPTFINNDDVILFVCGQNYSEKVTTSPVAEYIPG